MRLVQGIVLINRKSVKFKSFICLSSIRNFLTTIPRRVNRIQLYSPCTIRFEAAVAPPKSVKAHYAQNQFGSNS